MKQFLDIAQTEKLLSLGFTSPKSVSKLTLDIDMDTIPSFGYSVGELLSFLPQYFNNHQNSECVLSIETGSLGTWDVVYKGFEFYMRTCDYELIDAIYEMLLELTDKKILMQYGRT